MSIIENMKIYGLNFNPLHLSLASFFTLSGSLRLATTTSFHFSRHWDGTGVVISIVNVASIIKECSLWLTDPLIEDTLDSKGLMIRCEI